MIYIVNTTNIPKATLNKFLLSKLGDNAYCVVTHKILENTKKAQIVEELDYIKNTDIIITFSSKIFSSLTKLNKCTQYIGYLVQSEYGNSKIVYMPSPATVFTNPEAIEAKINYSISAILKFIEGTYTLPGQDIIQTALYPEREETIKDALDFLLELDCPLTVDIETLTLKHYSAGIVSIAFAWNKHCGIAFAVDYHKFNPTIRNLLKEFFIKNQNTLIFHNACFDATILIYQLFMETLVDQKGLLQGLHHVLKNFEDTKLIAYLCLNSTARPSLTLKSLAQEYSGKYAIESIKNVRNEPLPSLLEYNLIDTLATWFVYDTYYSSLEKENQLELYLTMFKPAVLDIVQSQLTGMPIDPIRVQQVKLKLKEIFEACTKAIQDNVYIQDFTQYLNELWVINRNAKLKVKRVSLADANEVFNPNSNVQLQSLLYTFLKLPVIALTESKQPSTDSDTLNALKNHTKDSQIIDLLDNIFKLSEVSKILTSFIPAFEQAVCAEDGYTYLYGSFHLGATVSGRMSSSNINLQQIPNNSTYGKLIKSCFTSNEDWLFVGLDYNALEDKISALTTKDPHKMAVYLEGFDGHSLRAYSYFQGKMEDITKQLDKIKPELTYYKVEHDDGSIEYLTSEDPLIINYLKEK